MTNSEYVSEILTALGHPIVKIECEDSIPLYVNRAFKEVRRCITDTRLITLPFRQMIDLSDQKVNAVIRVLRGNTNYYTSDNIDPFYIMHNSSYESIDTSSYAKYLLTSSIKNTISTDLDFIYDKGSNQLHISANYPVPASITLMYIPEYEDVSEVKEDHWIQLIQRLALAYTKESLGRIRGKYTLNNANYSLDADRLLSESAEEIASIRAYLDENSDILLPMD